MMWIYHNIKTHRTEKSYLVTAFLSLDWFRMSATLKIQKPVKRNPETGSCFDATNFEAIKVRPTWLLGWNQKQTSDIFHSFRPQTRAGGYSNDVASTETGGFSLSQSTSRPSPTNFMKKGTGLGGTVVRDWSPAACIYTHTLLLLIRYLRRAACPNEPFRQRRECPQYF